MGVQVEKVALAVEGEVLRDLGRFELALSVLVGTVLDCFVSLSPSAIVAFFCRENDVLSEDSFADCGAVKERSQRRKLPSILFRAMV